MRKFVHQAAVFVSLLFLSVTFIAGSAVAAANPEAVSITIFDAEGNSTTNALVRTDKKLIWQNPCMPPPYDYQYQDETRFMSIRKLSENDITYFVVDVQLASVSAFRTALSKDQAYGDFEPVSDIAARNQAILAINGDDYATQTFGTIIRNGELIRAKSTTRNMLIVDQHGNMSVLSDRKGENPITLSQQLLSESVWQTFEFGPELVRDGQAVSFSRAFDVISISDTRREPRTAIGQISALHYVIIVADGRQDGYSIGMTLPELQDIFIKYGTVTAMNLDGGGSAELWFKGQILNRPSGGDERYVSDIIYF